MYCFQFINCTQIKSGAINQTAMRFLLILAFVAVVSARPEDGYDPKYDDFNVDEVIDNVRLFKAYALCFEGEGKCTPDGNHFKSKFA